MGKGISIDSVHHAGVSVKQPDRYASYFDNAKEKTEVGRLANEGRNQTRIAGSPWAKANQGGVFAFLEAS